MRLIDADAFIEYLGLDVENAREDNVGEIVTLEDFDRQPTAFDKEKVIEKINREIEYHHEKSKIASMEIRAYSDGAERAYRLLRNIVEKSGIE